MQTLSWQGVLQTVSEESLMTLNNTFKVYCRKREKKKLLVMSCSTKNVAQVMIMIQRELLAGDAPTGPKKTLTRQRIKRNKKRRVEMFIFKQL